MKKYFSLLLVILLLFIFTGCDGTTDDSGEITLPDLTNLSRDEISKKLDDLGINYIYKFSDAVIHNDSELDKFVSYNGDLKTGSVIKKNYQVYVYTTVLPLTSHASKTLKLDLDYKGKSFINDGVGVVTLVRPTDGDTATFRDSITGEEFRLRFLGIDTPESTTAGDDPWGYAAKHYTKHRLQEANEIVLEAEGARQETYGRYLGFVWVDGVLLNLELIEECYTNSTLSGSKYESYFMEASLIGKQSGRRFFGETDPNYNYTRKYTLNKDIYYWEEYQRGNI